MLAVSTAADPTPPKFTASYHSSGVLHLPYAELDEPFQIFYDVDNKRSRVDFYNGLDTVYLFENKTGFEYGVSYSISPETVTDEVKTGCFQVNGTNSVTISIQSFIPDVSDFKYVGKDIANNVQVDVWKNVTEVGKKTNTYTFMVSQTQPPRPVRYEMIGYDTLIGSHYDRYYVDYYVYSTKPIDDFQFDLPKGLKCGSFPGPGIEHHIATNPHQEIFSPDKGDRYNKFYESYKDLHGKRYSDDEEHSKRQATFKHNVRFIHSTNRKHLGYKVEVNHLADLFDEELRNMRGRLYTPGNNNGLPYDGFPGLLPTSMDWRIMGAVSQVKDQATCGSCWSFGTTGTIEGAYFLKTGKMVRLSQQNLMDCSWKHGNNGCDGGEEWRSYEWIMEKGGLEAESTYGPYLGQNGKCHFNSSNAVIQISKYYNITSGSQEALKSAIAKIGPISVGIDAAHKSLSYYSSGVYYEPKCGNKPEDLDHAVLAVGYGKLNNEHYWLIKNSWSTNWGNNGYVLINQQDNNCGVTTDATYVTLK
ncbi:digestive cysteine proteinase 2-like isoform X2 [Anneissia japonica]|nr:digestive cysteine proteinase 2-like isoform X2 [Anneissia japonica]XP_033113651.1 digestive cysteine proteinase 2-like isoform X2 [Anneissia japonica]